MPGLGSLLSGVTVNAARRAIVPQIVSRTISNAIANTAASAVAGAIAPSSQTAATVARTTAPPDGTPAATDVAPVDVTAQPIAPGGSLAPGAVSQLINAGAGPSIGADQAVDPVTVVGQPDAGAGAAAANLVAPAAAGAVDQALASPTELEGVDVVAPRREPPKYLDIVSPAVTGALDLQTPPSGDGLVSLMDDPQKISPIEALAPLALLANGTNLLTPPTEVPTTVPGTPGFDPKTLLPLAPLVPLAVDAIKGNDGKTDPGTALTDLANKTADTTKRLTDISEAGFQGKLGGNGMNALARMVRHAQAAIRQRYAGMGMNGSTAEEADLQAAADAGVDLQFKIGQQMATAGLAAIAGLTGQSAAIYTSLLNAQTAKDTALGNALANFAAAVAK